MNDETPTENNLKGKVLAAAPSLLDPNFTRTLVYMAKHDDEGAFGLVLNRPTGKTLNDALTTAEMPEELNGLQVYFGGPVHTSNLLLAVFQQEEPGEEIVCKIEMNFEQIMAHIDDENCWVRAFVGCSGWGEGQLEQELDEKSWKICPTDPLLFEEKYTQKLWAVYLQGVEDWRDLLPFLPDHPENN